MSKYTVTNSIECKQSRIRQLFDSYVEETITEEQIQRLLSPVLRMIYNGCFDSPRKWFQIFRIG